MGADQPGRIKNLQAKSQARVAVSKEFKKIKEDIKKNQDRGKILMAGDLLKDKESKDKSKEKKSGVKDGDVKNPEDLDDDENVTLTREERKKKYLERADVQEAMQVAADLATELAKPGMRVGQKIDGAPSKEQTED